MAKEIYKWSLGYTLGKLYVKFAYRFFYSSISVRGTENIPKSGPVIITPNHQNALMDALAIVYTVPGQVVFVARADIFANRFFARILRFLKIMPVFRSRDGFESLGRNSEIFNTAVATLYNSRFFCIMPEGTHSEKHQLRPLVKGAFRLAFQYIEKHPNTPAPKILPVGIEYTSYYKYKSKLIISFGKPIDSTHFYSPAPENQPLAINNFRNKLANDLKNCMLHIDCGGFYNCANNLRLLLRPVAESKLKHPIQKGFSNFEAEKLIVERCNRLYLQNPDLLNEICKSTDLIINALNEKKVRPEKLFSKKATYEKLFLGAILLTLYFPIFIATYIYFLIPFLIPKYLVSKVDDIQFHSSVKFAVNCLFLPLWLLLSLFVFSLVLNNFLLAALIVTAFLFTGQLAHRYIECCKNWHEKFILLRHHNYFAEIRQIALGLFNKMG